MAGQGSLSERDARALWHPYTQHGLEREALPVARAAGSLLMLEDGREIVDAISSWWTCLHGHAHPRLVAALWDQAARLDHVLFAGCTHEPAVALAEELLAVAPPGLARVFYSDDGSTAVEVALKIALQGHRQVGESDRRVFVALEGAYHGDTFGSMAVGEREPFFAPFEPLLFEVRRAAVDASEIASALAELGRKAAGVILEPLVQGAGGMRMHAPELVRAAREACDRHGVPLIADEVMTGFGRTGTLFACEQAGVTPDLLCLAKGLTGGMLPLAATLTTQRWFERFVSTERARAFFHGHSFTASPLGCAVARASLALCRESDTPAMLDALGKRIEERVRSRLGARANELFLRRRGGIVALDLGGGRGYLAPAALELRARALERGVLLRPLGEVLYAMPPASTSADQADLVADTLAELALR
jgi:adenosylmethionine---8-amino-7-oxononanoate aminotransferase